MRQISCELIFDSSEGCGARIRWQQSAAATDVITSKPNDRRERETCRHRYRMEMAAIVGRRFKKSSAARSRMASARSTSAIAREPQGATGTQGVPVGLTAAHIRATSALDSSGPACTFVSVPLGT